MGKAKRRKAESDTPIWDKVVARSGDCWPTLDEIAEQDGVVLELDREENEALVILWKEPFGISLNMQKLSLLDAMERMDAVERLIRRRL